MTISLNSDLGEGKGNDALIMPYLSACNIACSGHYGNEETILQTILLAKKHKVKIGAHPSYPDTKNFGRTTLNISEENLIQSIKSQLALVEKVAEQLAVKFHHIKAHGALYNDIAKDDQKAKIYLKALAKYKEYCLLFVPPASTVLHIAKQQGYLTCIEAFADRAYNNDLSLVNRKLPNAIIEDKERALKQVLSIAENGEVVTTKGERITLKAATFCVHSDTANAVDIVKYIHHHFHSKKTKS